MAETHKERLDNFRNLIQINIDFWQDLLAVTNTPSELADWLEWHTTPKGEIVSPWEVWTPIDDGWPQFCPACQEVLSECKCQVEPWITEPMEVSNEQ